MKLPIDTSTLNFTCSLAPKAVVDFDTKAPKMDNGEAVFTVEVVAFAEEGAQIMSVKTASLPLMALKQGTPLRVVGLMAATWSMDGRNGLSFKAARIEPLNGSVPAKAAS